MSNLIGQERIVAMQAQTAVIKVRNLRLRTFIGFNAEEREKQQDIVVNLEIEHEIDPAAFEDRVEAALNYKTITKAVIKHVENGRFLLLERLVNDVLTICCADASVIRATVTIDKPHALRFADSVSVTLAYDRNVNLSLSENLHDYKRRPFSHTS